MGIPRRATEAIPHVLGLTIGPRLIIDYADIVDGMFIALIAPPIMVVFCLSTMRVMLYVGNVPSYISPSWSSPESAPARSATA
jgi:hypothetical protein